ncbi:MAG TPA: peptidoglycan bridge formation glycyltransferase FemA/FemB family protein [Candidatus Limnocylindrales bacterium]|nr:peptidoglycan bridge formation glycyltransferase FemA/FemB family protein [Candidatus Limnocylindrales bacterium]
MTERLLSLAGDVREVPATAVEADPVAWDRWVAGAPLGSYLQLSAWARVKAANGWSSVRLAAGAAAAGDPVIGAQVLIRRPRPMPWAFAYAPRGPVAVDWTPDAIEIGTQRLRSGLRAAERVSHVRIDPEVERDGPVDPDGALRRALRSAGWRPAPPIQPGATRVIDLRADEDALWGDLRKKWRQYVNKARSNGIRVVDGDGSRLGDFYRIYRETADRAGFLIRTEATYRATWEAFAPEGRARLLFAETADGEPVAALFLLSCGPRVVEPYGGMTEAGADSRANYLLKWEAIRSSRERGATTYDLWGLAHAGIAHFKAGFGGREVQYVGAWDLVLDPAGRLAYDAAQRARVWVERRRHGLDTSGSAAAFDGSGGAA